jgi:hypothetical protein
MIIYQRCLLSLVKLLKRYLEVVVLTSALSWIYVDFNVTNSTAEHLLGVGGRTVS